MTTDYKALLKRAYAKLEELEAKLAAVEQSRREPIAVIGMGVRFPGGADDPESLWRLLRDGVDAVTEVPAARWSLEEYYDPDPDAPGKAYTRWGAFLDHVDRFDPYFFGISPREASSMDPQQRILLEVAWEALERAGYASPQLAGGRVGVYVGMVATDYAHLARGDLTTVDPYTGTGMARSIAAGRLSYHLGVHGPNMAVDTACSSSLVAVHLAVQSLRARESDMALAGGVNLILAPDGSITASRARMMSFTGRCRTFDASADGYVRAEGCAVVVLKRLSDAIADGDNILGVILGSAINQDGRSAGIAAPNGKAQEMVIRAALEDAGIEPGDVSFVEAHGTGTPLGDPIEVRALASVFGASHTKEAPLVIGSIKSNLGHTEATAGVAGLAKVLLALKHGEIPPNLHFREPNPRIPWDEIPFMVPVEPTPWKPRGARGRIAGVSSFGFSGTNAHVIVAEWRPAIEEEGATHPDRPVQVLTLSARSDEALRELAERHEAHLASTDASFADIAFTANAGRSHFAERLALVADSASTARQTLAEWLKGNAPAGVVRGTAPAGGPPEVVFLFTGQGSQYAGMGRELYESSPVFRSALERCAAVLEGELEVPLLEVLYPEPGGRGEGLLDRTEYTQPALFALEWSLAELWRSWGVEPSLVLGHSVGEYVAACVAGVLEVEEALRLVALRGRLMGSLPAGGVMVAVFAPEARVREVVERLGGGQVSIAAVNGPESVVVSGAGEAVERVVGELVGAGVGVQRLRVSHAFHSPLMDPVVGEFERVASGVRYGEARLGVVSNVTGEVVGSEVLGCGSYWARQLREAVRYADGVRALWARGQRVFVEVGPGATLVNLGRTCVPEADQGLWLSSLRSGRGDWETLLSSLAELYVRGVEVDWAGLDRPYRRRRVELPTYPFQRQRYWLNLPQRAVVRRGPTVHPLLGQRVRSPVLDATVFECEIGIGTHAYLTDHRLHEIAVFPAAGYLEMGLAAARQVFGDGAHALEHVVMGEALVLPEEGTRLVQVAVKQEEEGVATFEVFSLVDGDQDTWTRHASGRIRRADRIEETSSATSLEEVGGRCRAELQPADVYEVLTALGAQYGPAFRALSSVRRRDGEALSRIEAPATIESSTGSYLLHPALADACIQTFGPAIEGFSISDRDGNCYMPVEVGSYRLYQPGVRSFRCRVTVVGDRNSDVLRGDVELYDAAGRLIGEMHAVRLLRIDREMLQRVARRASDPRVDDILYRVEWQRIEAPSAEPAPGTWLILADRGGVADALADRLERQGHVVVMVRPDASGGIGRDRIAAALSAARGLGGGLPFRGAIHLVGLDATAAPSTTSLEAEHERVCGSALALVQASAAAGMQGATVLYVTRGAQAVTGQEGALAIAQAPLWGLVRTVQLEHTESRSVLIDLEPSRGAAATQDAVDAILAELGANDGEDQVALRGGQRYAARLTRYTRPASGLQLPAGKPYVITVSERGVLDNIVVRPLERRPPGPGEVEIEVRASGLNFRDVLNVLGMYPGDPGPIGSECAGVVTAVGAGVTHVAVGDRVMAMGQGAFGSHLTTSAHSVYRIPAGMSFAEAASIPVAFMTAYYGLHELARIREGDRVLIHAAAGGVGLAAVQLALRAGAEVFGTAGSPEKREYLKSIGVHHVFNSRTLDFADEIMEVTGGRGVDIVLNSLADEFIPRSLGVLADHGRFLEIGKRGVWTAEQVAEFNPTIEYHLYDLGVALMERPERAAEMLDRLVPEFESGALRPLPLRTFAARDAVDAFRFMAQARHMGKIVITHGDAAGGFPVHADATYLITGGAGGLGLVVARALVERGARHLVLMGRSAPREAASAEIAELAASGVRIEMFRGDVGNEDDVARLMDHVAASLPPLRGIVHAAGVVDDGVLLQQTWERFQKVARPKIAGAWNLHAATRALPLDFFVLFSTGSAVLGSAGQGNYAAANAFLDALAHRRRAEGLPALSINWGAWAGGGMAAMVSEHDRRRWSEMGVGLIEPSEGILALERLIADGATQAAVLPMDWARYLGQPGVSERPILRGMLGGARRQQRATGPASSSRPRLREELEAADPARRMEMLIDHVRDRVVKVLGLGPSIHVDERQLLTDLGMDSLMAVELSNHLQASLACKLPPTLAFEYPSIRAMAEYLATDVLGLALPGRDSNGTDAPADGPFVITPIAVTE